MARNLAARQLDGVTLPPLFFSPPASSAVLSPSSLFGASLLFRQRRLRGLGLSSGGGLGSLLWLLERRFFSLASSSSMICLRSFSQIDRRFSVRRSSHIDLNGLPSSSLRKLSLVFRTRSSSGLARRLRSSRIFFLSLETRSVVTLDVWTL